MKPSAADTEFALPGGPGYLLVPRFAKRFSPRIDREGLYGNYSGTDPTRKKRHGICGEA